MWEDISVGRGGLLDALSGVEQRRQQARSVAMVRGRAEGWPRQGRSPRSGGGNRRLPSGRGVDDAGVSAIPARADLDLKPDRGF